MSCSDAPRPYAVLSSARPSSAIVLSRMTNFCGLQINISTVMAGQRLGIKAVDEAIWLVSFMHYDLGYIDLEQRTLQTIDNPFGSRLSPMS
jgi:hypothetical protein